MTPHPPELIPIARHLRKMGLTVAEGPFFIQVVCDDGTSVSIETRPPYCDRGRFIVKVLPGQHFGLEFDSQDGFPRYYYRADSCALEILEFVRTRKLVANV